MKKVYELDFAGRKLQVETGEIAKQADGAVFMRFGDTVVLSTACCADTPREGDFFPLTVEYREKQDSVGKIPQSFMRREGRPGTHATLTARLIDRPIRPLFAEGFRNEVQIVNTVFSCNPDNSPEMTGMLGSSLALCISDIPFEGPIAGVIVGRVDGELIIDPTEEQAAQSDINLTVAGTKDAIMMVEAGADQVPEEEMLDAIMFAHESIKVLCEFQEKIVEEIGNAKREIELFTPSKELVDDIQGRIGEKLVKAISIFDKLERQHAVEALKDEILVDYDNREYESEKHHNRTMMMVRDILEQMVATEVRRLITDEKIRPDGRKSDEIRPLDAQVDLLPRVHGSAMFTRGQTQVISSTTLGPMSDAKIIDNLTSQNEQRFLHHYNFPPYSVGECGRIGSPGRREIGHGALGERALSYVIPSAEEFPYTIRTTSEVVESNGSSSQASICAGCMSLMAAGVPVKGIVSGIAMGLITSGPFDGNHPYTILTDIQGLEDHFGDMDFKCAGTENGLTALQMDIKIHGVTREVLDEALQQAKKARAEIREVMSQAIAEPREDVSEYAPKMTHFTINPDKIRDVIGTGGKVINEIIDTCDGVKIDVEDTGDVTIYHDSREMINKAAEMIQNIVRVAKVGEIFEGTVSRVEGYGAFVNLFGTTDGLCHVSRLDWKYINDANDVVKVGDKLKVVVIGLEDGKVSVSHREFLDKPADYEERPARKSSNGGSRGGRDNRRGGDRGRRDYKGRDNRSRGDRNHR